MNMYMNIYDGYIRQAVVCVAPNNNSHKNSHAITTTQSNNTCDVTLIEYTVL